MSIPKPVVLGKRRTARPVWLLILSVLGIAIYGLRSDSHPPIEPVHSVQDLRAPLARHPAFSETGIRLFGEWKRAYERAHEADTRHRALVDRAMPEPDAEMRMADRPDVARARGDVRRAILRCQAAEARYRDGVFDN